MSNATGYDIVWEPKDGKFYLKDQTTGEIRKRSNSERKRGHQTAEAAEEALADLTKE